MRPELGEVRPGEQEISELQLLLARRRDLITDRSRTITHLREALLSLFPALERALDLNSKGPLILLTTRPPQSSDERVKSASLLIPEVSRRQRVHKRSITQGT